MARRKKPRKKRYSGRDSAQPPQIIKVQAEPKSSWQNWWDEHKATVVIRLFQAGLALLLYGLLRLVWSLLS